MLVENPFSKPSFFYLMIHLVLHLVDELDICGPVHSCWMYPIEQATKNLKGYIRNLCKPEGSVAKGYIFDEALGLYTKYMQNFQTMRLQFDPIIGALKNNLHLVHPLLTNL